MTLLVRDEQDILRENLDYHLARGVDEVILMDNLSSDGTADIAREYERAGKLHYMFQPRDDYSQGRWVTQMANRAINELGADWVINGDADEFWWPCRGSIKDAFASIEENVVAVSVERSNFVARVDNGEPFWQRMNIRRLVSLNPIGEPLPAKVAHRALADIVVEQGNHRVHVGGRLADCAPGPLTILHFPVRSRAQFRNKIAKGGAAYARNTELDQATGSAWRFLYGLYLDGELDEVYDKEVMAEEEIAVGLAAGALVRDNRLVGALDSRTSSSV
ncbi:MAG TPA: glycosyltransferase family 2 protein [Candidatus Elarobacter sp.]|nr:glycosyltransferase family 2 protein [Candidatus Elarobacter sp.]